MNELSRAQLLDENAHLRAQITALTQENASLVTHLEGAHQYIDLLQAEISTPEHTQLLGQMLIFERQARQKLQERRDDLLGSYEEVAHACLDLEDRCQTLEQQIEQLQTIPCTHCHQSPSYPSYSPTVSGQFDDAVINPSSTIDPIAP